ncbi:MAG: hypothetical protein JNM57_12420 [Cyclobacteriaceae bacterium]|nr:hypothetical protein [Cyclobacteriaceae bacterium]
MVGAKLFLIMGCITVANFALAQRMAGLVVLNSGDTLRGIFKLPSAKYLLHHEVVFGPDESFNEKYKLYPEEVKGFSIGEDVYESHFIWSGKATKKFLKIAVTGYCTLFEYQHTSKNSKGIVGQPVRQYYAQKMNQLLHTLDFVKLRKGKDTYFADNIGLTLDIRHGHYKKSELPEIVRRYNQEYIHSTE